MKEKTELIIIGGFLGAGKTTTLEVLAQLFQSKGKTVGLITNDQARNLVDTQVLTAKSVEVREISGSCFCCDFDGLMEAALYLRETKTCEIVIAEPVGSCTDLSATLLQPVKAYYHRYFKLAPLSVLIDPLRLMEMFKQQDNRPEGSAYIYLKQLEEADHLVVNKVDTLSRNQEAELKSLLDTEFPDYPVHWISAIDGKGISSWLEQLSSDTGAGVRIAEVDYDKYARGEAMMGWLNASCIITHTEGLSLMWQELNLNFVWLLQQVFQRENIVIGHIKTFLKSGPSHLSCNLTHTEGRPRISGSPFSSRSSRFVLNIRAETSPETLKEIVNDLIYVYEERKLKFEIIELKNLSPGRPTPTHRFKDVINNGSY
ncbi:MAG: hypothetical protein MI975_13205 [Cytophagales bacterium]|nr:hypothetical protein [Cytophagales bacterium]